MFKNLRIGLKLAIGFGTMLLMAIVITCIALYSQGKMATGSRAAVNNAQIVQDMLEGRVAVLYYLWKKQDSYVDDFNANMDELLAGVDRVSTEGENNTTLERLRGIRENAKSYSQGVAELLDGAKDFKVTLTKGGKLGEEVQNNITDIMHNVESSLTSLILQQDDSRELNNYYQQLAAIQSTLNSFLKARITMLYYLWLENPDYLDKTRDILKEVLAKIESMELNSSSSLQPQLTKLLNTTKQYQLAIEEIREKGINQINIVKKMAGAGLNVADLAQEANAAQRVEMENTIVISRDLLFGIAGIALVIGGLFALFITRAITKPITTGVHLAASMANGDFTKRMDQERGDELGDLARAVNIASESLEQRTTLANAIADGDLTQDVIITSNKDALGHALDKMLTNMREIIGSIADAAAIVEAGSSQVSQSSQSLSQGTTELAASSEEINSSMTEISSQTRANSDNAAAANSLAIEARQTADKGGHEMEEMVTAMSGITQASEAISKIIKVIDEIAFQTNLLALNAAVEAARAGRHGKGFAVVAEEVRSLAGRSAKAAQETTLLIEGSVEKIRRGGEKATTTAESFADIVKSVASMADLVQEINLSSTDQAEAIRLINEAMHQMEKVTQNSTANAEETAAAAEELNSQSQQLRDMVGRFRLKAHSTVQAYNQPPMALDGADWEPEYETNTNGFAQY